MKPLQHHVDRLLERWLQAETCTDRSQAEKITRKAEKHERKIARWHQRMLRLGLWGRP